MSHCHKFDPKGKDKLKDPERLQRENPDLIWKTLALGNPKNFIDIGCGVGFSAIPFSKKMPEGTIYACDISQEMLDALKEEIEKEGITNVSPILMEEVKVPLDSGISDCVYSQNIYHEFHQLEASLAEFMRLLKPGGKFVVIDWKPGDTPHGPPQEVRVPAERIMDDLAKCGFVAVNRHDVLPYHSFVTALKPE